MSEYNNKRGVVLDHNFPVMPIILMAAAIILRLIGGGKLADCFVFHACAVLIIMGMILHRLNLQILTGIGTLGYAVYSLFTVFRPYIYGETATFLTVFGTFVFLLAFAAYVVAGLHYVIRRPKPGKTAKLILMIPLVCLLLIYGIVMFINECRYLSGVLASYVLLNYLALILMSFALMIYTPFREA
ncbi:MAG: hypothetical protein IJA26_04720 [Clostridia bacterium]|nr:hypothetical protein [Clostridia bacterium]